MLAAWWDAQAATICNLRCLIPRESIGSGIPPVAELLSEETAIILGAG